MNAQAGVHLCCLQPHKDRFSRSLFFFFSQILKIKRYWILNIVVGAGLGMFTAMTSFLDQILCPRGYTDVSFITSTSFQTRSRGYKTFFILNSAEHEMYPAHKC